MACLRPLIKCAAKAIKCHLMRRKPMVATTTLARNLRSASNEKETTRDKKQDGRLRPFKIYSGILHEAITLALLSRNPGSFLLASQDDARGMQGCEDANALQGIGSDGLLDQAREVRGPETVEVIHATDNTTITPPSTEEAASEPRRDSMSSGSDPVVPRVRFATPVTAREESIFVESVCTASIGSVSESSISSWNTEDSERWHEEERERISDLPRRFSEIKPQADRPADWGIVKVMGYTCTSTPPRS
ncbi:hypothetical protein H2199_005283 [Coniosporium tulheliwenetii]|uniref:Uncharacterized protein n=1 Tax=Coniosporium tulheliwenetii TaxID=3383036 RepID=A0ACC2Z3E1_9PEZI|nr:hypothetical protein H2199_005283 [Cladosporium sp. JES 115]